MKEVRVVLLERIIARGLPVSPAMSDGEIAAQLAPHPGPLEDWAAFRQTFDRHMAEATNDPAWLGAMEEIRWRLLELNQLDAELEDLRQTDIHPRMAGLGVAPSQPLPPEAQGARCHDVVEGALNAGRGRRRSVLQGLRAEVAEMDALLSPQRMPLSQAVWLGMDPAAVGTMLHNRSYRGTRLSETVDPRTVAVSGTYPGFRRAFPGTEEGRREARNFEARYLAHGEAQVEQVHVLPTGGVFAEAVLGAANSGEKLDLTRFWKWDEDTIPILPTASSQLQSRAKPRRAGMAPGQLGPAAVRLQALQPAPAGPGWDLAGVVGAQIFRDMAGADAIAQLPEAGQTAAEAGILL